MRTVTVNASRIYNIEIECGILDRAGEMAAKVIKPCTAAILTDTNVAPLYAERLEASLISAGYSPIRFTIEAGEKSKSAESYLSFLNFLASNRITRSDCIFALGGGVVGDLAGFAAATYLRGIRFVQIPTTLLAMVDSSVGGKTAIDLPAGKNLAGAFYQPDLVLCDIDALHTLPDHIFRDGCAEVIKYGILYDPQLFEHLTANGLDFDREYVVTRCVELKRDVVADDEFDRDVRQKLNLGHTIGHGIEASSHFGVSHGLAVASGIGIVTRAASKNGICSEETYSQVISTLEHFGLPHRTQYTAEDIYKWALSDKKRSGATVNLIVPKAIGDCVIIPTATDELKSFIEAGL